MRSSKRTIGADLESPFLDEQMVGTDSGSGVTDRLESGNDEYAVTEAVASRDGLYLSGATAAY